MNKFAGGPEATSGPVRLTSEVSGRTIPEAGGRAIPEANGRAIPEAEVQLLPPRLSAVLTQLRLARQQLSAGRRQNKVYSTCTVRNLHNNHA